jgi:hypothetical protein
MYPQEMNPNRRFKTCHSPRRGFNSRERRERLWPKLLKAEKRILTKQEKVNLRRLGDVAVFQKAHAFGIGGFNNGLDGPPSRRKGHR